MPPQSPSTVSSHAISQRLLLCSSLAESWLERLRPLVSHRDHVNMQGTQWSNSTQLRDVCLAAQSDTFIPWRTVTSLSHHELVQRTRLDKQYTQHMQQLRNDWHHINESNPGSIRVFHSNADGNCFFYTFCQHMTGSESHHFLFRLHVVIELLFNIDYYMNFTNGCISKYAGYVNVHSTANGAWRLRNVLCDAIVALGCESRTWSGL